jgi:hypothetical protein
MAILGVVMGISIKEMYNAHCPTERTLRHLCRCHNLDKSWSCPSNTVIVNGSDNFLVYFGVSAVENGLLSVLVLSLLFLRLRCTSTSDPCPTRTEKRTEELILQLRIARGFLGVCVAHKVILLAMLFLCNKPTEGPSRVASHFLELIFIILAGMYNMYATVTVRSRIRGVWGFLPWIML